MSGTTTPPKAPAEAQAPAPSRTCDDCGKTYQGEAKAHYASTHGGMPRFRWSDSNGSTIQCAKCGAKKTSPLRNHRLLDKFLAEGHRHDSDDEIPSEEET